MGEEPSINEQLASRLLERQAVGVAKYGKPLYPFDGRRTLEDAEDEALDLAVYIRKERVERYLLEAVANAVRAFRANPGLVTQRELYDTLDALDTAEAPHDAS